MIFQPTNSEQSLINLIRTKSSADYSLIRLTDTMLKKSIMDASALIRSTFKLGHIVDYDLIEQGQAGKKCLNGTFLSDKASPEIIPVKVSFYRPNTKKGDPRFWINRLKSLKVASTGDLLYITTSKVTGSWQPIFLNLSNNSIENNLLDKFFGDNDLTVATGQLLALVKNIANEGFVPNKKGAGKIVPKDVGETFESLLNIPANQSKLADFKGIIELKAKRSKAKSRDTLFSMVPHYNREIADGSNQFVRKFGYPSTRHEGYTDLFVTVSNKKNRQGLFLEVDEANEQVVQYYQDELGKKAVAYWNFKEMRQRLYQKHNSTLWILADERLVGDTYQFFYNKAQLTRRPSFTAFLTLIQSGKITFDWRARVKPDGTGYKDKGNVWRTTPKYRKDLFGNLEILNLKNNKKNSESY
ncbi:MvaI/BcnI family restriction endonuclease [Liquorilactobacillus hordei]|uniref:MvaI/BcnI family restriction endonuclease n=1 Tax=Liquorilactobacillus hordei TaxID=468911 RepID=UPI001CC0B471|nr:MvaI/BcnI family restriction endonuclease [Liquorilactobacillus hordei]MBZ2405774.1 restriction endonuclease [Liquorilactobacillus hordei]